MTGTPHDNARREQIQAKLRRRAARGEVPDVFGFELDDEETAYADAIGVVMLTFQPDFRCIFFGPDAHGTVRQH